jgi:hypothetical protein
MTSEQPNKCRHKYIHLETKKIRGERPSYGFSPARDWERIDIYYCEKCLEKKITKQVGDWLEYLDRLPEWW